MIRSEPIAQQEEFLTVQEVADRLRTSTNNVNRWMRQGQWKGVKVKRQWRIDREDFENWLEKEKNR